jgi:hypothetical protein
MSLRGRSVRAGSVAVGEAQRGSFFPRSFAMLTQLNPPLPLETSKGPGWAHFVIDYGPESALLWVVFMDADGACWTVPNFEVRMSYNWTIGRRKPGDTSTAPAASSDALVRFPRPA